MTSFPRILQTLLLAGLVPVLAVAGATGETVETGSDNGSWEMRVCAQPDAYPISSRERPGYENRLAQVLADHLDANLTFTWTRIDATGVRNSLQEGECDLVFGVLDGANGLLSTIPYHRAPYVFVYPADASFEIESLHDEELESLRIAVEPNSLQQQILLELGHKDQLVTVEPSTVTAAGYERIERLLAVIEEGEADLTIAYGPDASGLASDDYIVRAVQPEILPPFHQLFRTLTIGVRLNDDSFRDRLGIALAETWDEVQSVLAEYEVPRLSVVQPRAPVLERSDAVVGAVLPMPTGGWREPHDVEGMAARFGAEVAEDLSTPADAGGSERLRVLMANAPTVEASERATRRLIATEGVRALLGGIGEGQAGVMSQIAEEAKIPFFNIEDDDEELRAQCHAYTFNVAPDESMYLRGMREALSSQGADTWFVVYEETDLGQRLLEKFKTVLTEAGDELVGTEAVPPTPSSYRSLLAAIESSNAEGVALLQSPAGQEFLLSQYRLDIPVIGYPHPEMQTREYLGHLMQVVHESSRFRVVAWDPNLQQQGAERFNEVVVGRYGEPADLTAWTAFAAAEIAQKALGEVEDGTFEDLVSYLESEEATFELLKGEPLTFGRGNQLAQPLYISEIDLDATYNQRVGARVALATVADTLGPFRATIGCRDSASAQAR